MSFVSNVGGLPDALHAGLLDTDDDEPSDGVVQPEDAPSDHDDQPDDDLPENPPPPPARVPALPDMRKVMQVAGGPNYGDILREVDDHFGPDADGIPSERCGGESRRPLLKRKASQISRSVAETFAYLTSKTASQEEAAQILEGFGNVSLVFLLFDGNLTTYSVYFCIQMHIKLYLCIFDLTNASALLSRRGRTISHLAYHVKRHTDGHDAWSQDLRG